METEDEICEEEGGLKSHRAGCAGSESSTRSQSDETDGSVDLPCLLGVSTLALLGSQWLAEWEVVLRMFAALPEQGDGSGRGRYRTCWIIWGRPLPKLDWM